MATTVTELEGCLNSIPSTYLNEENVYDLIIPKHLIYMDVTSTQIKLLVTIMKY